MPNPLVSTQFVRLLDARLLEVSERTFTEIPSQIPQLYRTLDSDSAWEEFYEIGSVPDIPEFTGQLQYLSIAPGYYTKIEHKEYAGGIQIERKLLDDKKYTVLDDRAAGLAEAAARVREKFGVRPFAYAFSSSFDFMTSEENLSLCNTAHTTKSGTSTTSGFSNSGTSALTATSVAATRLLMRKFRNDISERVVISPDTLIVPDNLADKAEEIVGTPKGLYSAEGTVNVQQGRFKVIPYLRLDDYDTNNWFMTDMKLQKKFLVWIDRVRPDRNNTIDFETFLVKHSIYFRMSNGSLNWRFMYGHNVS